MKHDGSRPLDAHDVGRGHESVDPVRPVSVAAVLIAVLLQVTVTEAPDIAAPLGSVTWPSIVPDGFCARDFEQRAKRTPSQSV
jgi:hypothetical protein